MEQSNLKFKSKTWAYTLCCGLSCHYRKGKVLPTIGHEISREWVGGAIARH